MGANVGSTPAAPDNLYKMNPKNIANEILCAWIIIALIAIVFGQPSMNKENRVEIKETLNSILIDIIGLDKEKIKPEANLIDDLGADSLDVVELIMHLEREFDIDISDDDAYDFKTVQDITAYLRKQL